MKKWYAVMRDKEDTDWGYGSHNKREAAKMVREMRRNGGNESYIAVIDESGSEPICVEEIHDMHGI